MLLFEASTSALVPTHSQLLEKQTRLGQLKSGAVLVSKAERDKAVKWLTAGLESWRKRKAMFRNIWCGCGVWTYSVNMGCERGACHCPPVCALYQPSKAAAAILAACPHMPLLHEQTGSIHPQSMRATSATNPRSKRARDVG